MAVGAARTKLPYPDSQTVADMSHAFPASSRGDCGRMRSSAADAANSARQINGLIAKPAGNEFYFDPGRATNPGGSMCTEHIVAIELPTLSVGTP